MGPSDQVAYQRLLFELAPRLHAIVRRGMARWGAADTEDEVQDTLLAIHPKRHTWDADRPIEPWLRAITRNELIDNLRRRDGRIDVPIDGKEITAGTVRVALHRGLAAVARSYNRDTT